MSTRRVAALVVTAMPEEAQPFLEALPLVDKAEPVSLLGRRPGPGPLSFPP